MADYDFEVLNGMGVVRDLPVAEEPPEMQVNFCVPTGVVPVSEGGGSNIRTVPLLVRTTP